MVLNVVTASCTINSLCLFQFIISLFFFFLAPVGQWCLFHCVFGSRFQHINENIYKYTVQQIMLLFCLHAYIHINMCVSLYISFLTTSFLWLGFWWCWNSCIVDNCCYSVAHHFSNAFRASHFVCSHSFFMVYSYRSFVDSYVTFI